LQNVFSTSSTILWLEQCFWTCKEIKDVRCSRFGGSRESMAFYSLASMGCDWGMNGDK
jgi:hypothetical protein